MNLNFPRTLSLLRKEKGLSQKNAAVKLGVSQALLSHYEKGVREPGLSFVVSAADFYGVSADFLLGRTMSRDGTAINVEDIHDDGETNNNRLKGSAMSLFSKKILVNSLGILFDLLGKAENSALVKAAYSYLGAAIYKLFRLVYTKNGTNPNSFFAVGLSDFSDAVDAQMKISDMRFKRAASGMSPSQISDETLTRDYPLLYKSLLSVIHSSEKEIIEITEKSE